MRSLGAGSIEAVVGPCIHPECYEFGEADLDLVAARYGDGVRALTREGRPALDLPAGVRSALRGADVSRITLLDGCTACDADGYFSHRARGEVERQALVIAIDR
jgi:copper oxidase (laccase) domain-containing protein